MQRIRDVRASVLPSYVCTYLLTAIYTKAIWTNLSRHLDDKGTDIISKTGMYWKSLDEGAATMLVAAFDPALNGTYIHPHTHTDSGFKLTPAEPPDQSDVYLSNCQFAQAAPFALDVSAAERLYRLSEELVGRRFDL